MYQNQLPPHRIIIEHCHLLFLLFQKRKILTSFLYPSIQPNPTPFLPQGFSRIDKYPIPLSVAISHGTQYQQNFYNIWHNKTNLEDDNEDKVTSLIIISIQYLTWVEINNLHLFLSMAISLIINFHTCILVIVI